MFRISFGLCLLSLAVLIGLGPVGCSKKPVDKPNPLAGKKGEDHDEHGDEGPHGGALAEWGEHEYHAEFTVDHKEKKATVYILDKSAKKASPIEVESITLTIENVKPKVTVQLKADPDAGDPKGKSSRFTGTHDALAKEMEFKGEISGTVGKTPYAGTFDEKPHKHK
ncbi:MAG: hypothetical protein L0Y72_06850 [Gemmataceae bacterium]|nr:hypothetical protein [Gemmataceae bacterium]MCI0738743.1 hypothetical protein [Gemmataceae bacterium]